ncbi:hypothetical protein ZOSMA_2G02880 [Zostera marina]|uniref:Uncharacterized protein n=1 Tax=Zostera marina TaxID=29655 RepID=A0A0K9PBE1_ZOSMR|nr:hypothetical protein ZOSMA_2G02880 [Zostera marina]
MDPSGRKKMKQHGKDGEELERSDLSSEVEIALKSCRPNAALTATKEVQDDLNMIIDSGYFYALVSEPTVGETKLETIIRQLTTKKGQRADTCDDRGECIIRDFHDCPLTTSISIVFADYGSDLGSGSTV